MSQRLEDNSDNYRVPYSIKKHERIVMRGKILFLGILILLILILIKVIY